MISSGRISLPRYVESLKSLYVGNFTCDTLNGVLANFVEKNSQGYVVADFINHAIANVPHGVEGPINLIDGTARVILDIPNAKMQFELGAKDGPWTVIDSFAASGFATDGRMFAFISRGNDPADPRSLVAEFGVSDNPNFLKAWGELGAWVNG